MSDLSSWQRNAYKASKNVSCRQTLDGVEGLFLPTLMPFSTLISYPFSFGLANSICATWRPSCNFFLLAVLKGIFVFESTWTFFSFLSVIEPLFLATTITFKIFGPQNTGGRELISYAVQYRKQNEEWPDENPSKEWPIGKSLVLLQYMSCSIF